MAQGLRGLCHALAHRFEDLCAPPVWNEQAKGETLFWYAHLSRESADIGARPGAAFHEPGAMQITHSPAHGDA